MKKLQLVKLANAIGTLLTILVILFIVRLLYTSNISFTAVLAGRDLATAIIVGIILACSGLLATAAAWFRFLKAFGISNVYPREVYAVYMKSNIGKYLPGNFMHYIERNIFISEHGVGQAEAAASSICEVVGVVFAAIIICFTMSLDILAANFGKIIQLRYFISLIFLLILIGIAIYICYKKSEKLQYISLRMRQREFFVTSIKNLCLYILHLLAQGGVLLISLNLFCPINSITDIPIVLSMNTAAWLIGFLMPGSPGGIGVREALLVSLSSGMVYTDIMGVAAILQRAVLVLGDFSAYLAAVAWGTFHDS